MDWTPEYVGSLVGETFNGAWRIAEVHNAQLLSELKKYERLRSAVNGTVAIDLEYMASLEQQLLQAQAAIAAYRKAMEGIYNHNEAVRRAVVEHMGTL